MFRINKTFIFKQNAFKFTQIKISKFSTLNFNILLPNLEKHTISIEEGKTFSDLEITLKNISKHYTVEFRSWDNSIISKNNNLDLVFSNPEPVFMKISRMEWQRLNFNNFEYTTTENYHLKKDFSHNFISELHEIKNKVRQLNNNKLLNDQEVDTIAMQLFKIKHFYYNRDLRTSLNQYKNLEEIFNRYYELKSEYARLFTIKEKLMRSSQIKTKVLLLVAGLLFVLELFFVFYGTFVIYSWDIVEPITYLIGCFNFVLILYYRRKFGNMSTTEYWNTRFFVRMVKKKKFEQKLFEQTGIKLKEMEYILNN